MTHSPIVTVHDVRAARQASDALVSSPTPSLSWKSQTTATDWRQISANIRAERPGSVETVTVGSESVEVSWPFPPLEPGETVSISVRVTGSDGQTSAPSAPLTVRGAFFGDGGWLAKFIAAADPSPTGGATYLHRDFVLSGAVKRATLYATAQGAYQVKVNGKEVDDSVLKPGWTSYQFRLLYETTDVTTLLRPGRNALDITVAGGWFTESYSDIGPGKPFYGTTTAAAVQLVVEFVDGSLRNIVSDGQWRGTSDGPLTRSSIYSGESFDARQTLTAPDLWLPAVVVPVDTVPVPRSAPPVRRIEEIAVAEVRRTPSGKTVLDFGQNLVGRLRITVSGERGHTVVLRHAEVLDGGELATRPLRLAEATDTYTLAGGGAESWEPEFTFHGFRYAEITQWPGEFNPDDVVAVVVHTDMERTGWFECSDPLINQLHSNAVWGMRGNFLSLPTDCPQRDERFGWTGDIQAFAPSASYLYDSAGFLSSWLEDLWLEQQAAGGIVPFIVPDVFGGGGSPIAGWGDAATVVPWTLYTRFGSREVLESQFDSMIAWVDAVLAASGEDMLWESGFQFGDWLDPDAPFDDPGATKTDTGIVATAQFYRSSRILADTAAALGHTERATAAADLAERVRQAFLAAYVTPRGRMVSDTPTAYALALAYGIVDDPSQRRALGGRLAYLVRSSGYHISTGFIGTPVVQDALTASGHLDVAEKLFTQTENPSWLYPVTMGATTIWERWDSMLEDGSVNPGEMTSFNHYAFGSVVDWMHRTVAGLAPAAPGYRRIRIAPQPLESLRYARTRHETPYGMASVQWQRDVTGTVTVSAVVPPGTSAEVVLPGSPTFEVGSGSHTWMVAAKVMESRGPIGPGSTLAQIADDREAYQTVIAAIHRLDPEAADAFRRRTKWIDTRILIDDFTELAPDLKTAVEEAISNLALARAMAS